MKKEIQLSGLCINCVSMNQCGYRSNHSHPVLFCEEFICTEFPEKKKESTNIIIKSDQPVITPPEGICWNCDNAESCHLQKPGDCIQTCEEYI